jgi:hypothetical protein
MIKRGVNVCNLYLLLILLISFRGILFPAGGFIAQGLNLVFLLLSFYFMGYANSRYKLPAILKALNILLIMFTIYGLLLIIRGEKIFVEATESYASGSGYLKSIYFSLLQIYAFYVLARRGYLNENLLKFFFFLLFLLTVRAFFQTYQRGLENAAERGSMREEFTNNVGYAFVRLLPALVLFRKRPILQYIFLAVCGYFIVAGMKRGAILSGAICLIWFLYVNLKGAPKRRKWIVSLVTIALVMVGVYFVNYMMSSSAYFLSRYEATIEGESSGRNELYATFFNHFINEQNPFLFLFGNGANATLKISFNYAHNDWLEIAINQGLVGLLIYFVYWICFFVSWRKAKGHQEAFMAIGMTLIIFFMSTLYSMSYSGMTRCSAMVLGYYLAVSQGCFVDNNEVIPQQAGINNEEMLQQTQFNRL